MKILFISSKSVFPVRDGVELPLAKIMEGLSAQHEISLLRVYTNDEEKNKWENSAENPAFIKNYFYLKVDIRSGKKKLMHEIFGIKPFYFVDKLHNENDLDIFADRSFDWLWISPEGLFDIAKILKAKCFPNARFALGINEPQYTVFYNKFLNIVKRREPVSKQGILSIIRLPFIYFHEKRYLKDAHLIHVQTELEHRRLEKMLGTKHASSVVVAPNGIKEDLLEVSYENANGNILLIAAMDGSVKQIVDYFLQEVWIRFHEKFPHVKLTLVGRAPSEERKLFLENFSGVEVKGFVPEYQDAFKGASIAVLPLFQNHGLINRALDCLCVGIPLLGFKDALQTIDGLQNGVHAIAVNNAEEMIEQLQILVGDPNLRMQLSKNAKELAKSRPTWQKSVTFIGQRLAQSNGK